MSDLNFDLCSNLNVVSFSSRLSSPKPGATTTAPSAESNAANAKFKRAPVVVEPALSKVCNHYSGIAPLIVPKLGGLLGELL